MKSIFSSTCWTLAVAVVFLTTSCKKDSNKPVSGSGRWAFANSEYSGICNSSHYYPRPISIRFNGDSTMSVFSNILLNNYHKSVDGKVLKVEETSNGDIKVTVQYLVPDEPSYNAPQEYVISKDLSTITGGSAPLYVLVNMKKFPEKAPSVVGHWTAPDGYYPDVNGMLFYEDKTARYGRGILSSLGPNQLFTYYKQDGSRVTFTGVNESRAFYSDYFYLDYYGVLSPDGNTLYVDAYFFAAARLPFSSVQINSFGPVGVTPSLKRQ